jgi:gamma-glutamyltranspeptidase/glutathione hydrolase
MTLFYRRGIENRVLLMMALLLVAVPASRAGATAKHGMVVSADSLASTAGADVLKKGGNAVDAAVMVGFVLAVTYPEAGNLGGGGFMLIRMANGKSSLIDFREKAPGAARREMYLDSSGSPVPEMSQRGAVAAGVPGTVAGLLTALKRYGTKRRADLLEYPIKLAREGFRVNERLALSLQRFLPDSLASRSALKVFKPEGVPVRTGDILRQPDLAKTLQAIMDQGSDGFYRGSVADAIVAEVTGGGGIITREDLSAYRAVERAALAGSYRGYEILTSAPPA